MNILGISAFYHDSAAALVTDGRIIAASQEERYTRKKHDAHFPVEAIKHCLHEGRISLDDVNYVVFYEKPLLKFDRLLETYLAYAPRGFASFRKALPIWIREKLLLPREIRNGLKNLPGKYTGPLAYVQHHESHAASAFFPSPFDEAAVLTADGVGEWATASIARGEGNRLTMLAEQRFPHSLGLLYSAFTYYAGFKVNSGEYKLMGLAPYGVPRFQDIIEEKIVRIFEDGSIWMDMAYFNYCQGLTMTSDRFHRLFGQPPRKPESRLTQFDMDIAASIQCVTEKIMLKMAAHAHKLTGSRNLCLAGGVALNCVANGRILREGPFDSIWIQPAAGDAGGALGAALFVWNQLLENSRVPVKPDGQQGSYLGPEFSESQIRETLDRFGAVYEELPDDDAVCRATAEAMANEKVVGWFQGRMEFGPRALGARSIIGDARSLDMQTTMNLKIKFRESFRPFAPSVLRTDVHRYFEMRDDEDSPYMLLVAPITRSMRDGSEDALAAASGIDKLNIPRSKIQAVTHVDYSARVQTVDEERNPMYAKLIGHFRDITGCPVIINTSFNVRGEPIVCTPEEAYRGFMATEIDVLVLGRFFLRKDNQDKSRSAAERERLLGAFALD